MSAPAEPTPEQTREAEAAPGPRRARTRAALAVGALAVGALVALVPSGLHDVPGKGALPARGAALALVMALLWVTEAVPMAATAALPLVVAPLLGLYGPLSLSACAKSASPFLDAYIFLFFGGMALGSALEESGLHRRVALAIMIRVGGTPSRLVLGTLLATSLVSLWISNTATAVMMAPIALAIVAQLEAQAGGRRLPTVSTALLLSVAYGANLGGIGTKIGTATNSIFCGVVHDVLGVDLGFVRFMLIAAPFVLVALPLVWLVLARLGARDAAPGGGGRDVLRRELAGMGRPSGHERLVGAVFLCAAALWVGGELVRPHVTPLLSRLYRLSATAKHYEATVAMLAGLSLLALRGLSWRSLARMPWSSLVLLGGSFAMAQAIEGSGLGAYMGARLAGLATLPLPLALASVAAGTVALSAVASNTATINVALSVLPRSMPLFLAAMLGASCDFMLPAGTPPNAIVFGTGRVRLVTMIRVGALLDVGAALLIAVYVYVYARFVAP